jgi:hypothetical protein
MAVLAPIFFNLSVLIVIALFFRRSRYLGKFLFYQPHWHWSLIFLVAIVIPALAGFAMGAPRSATLLGHLFYTNMDHEKDITKTFAAWAALFLVAYLLSGAV